MTSPQLFDNGAPGAPRQVTLVRLAGEIARALVAVGRIAVEGEVHRPKMSRGGWTFFTLRDRAAQIEVVVPSANARRCRAAAGERVCVTGLLRWANDRGQVHLVADEVIPVGAGAVAEMVEETRRRLAADGILDRPKRELPLLPSVIGVVCGADAAVRKDIESVAAARFPGYPIHFEETGVSGPGASLSIVEGLRAVVAIAGVEVVILARGGGDGPSLLPWSTEEVCRAVASCPVPVVSAIGHESDRPLCDEVADLRCGTPSIAAAAVVPDRSGLWTRLDTAVGVGGAALSVLLDEASRRVAGIDSRRSLEAGTERAGARLARAGQRLADCHPSRQLRACHTQLTALDWRRPTGEILGLAKGRLVAEQRHLAALSPRRTLRRGYAVATGPGGEILRSAAQVQPGDRIAVELAEGSLSATVTDTYGGNDG